MESQTGDASIGELQEPKAIRLTRRSGSGGAS
jgi:hypothetical protein